MLASTTFSFSPFILRYTDRLKYEKVKISAYSSNNFTFYFHNNFHHI
jgi:hypothetical protein